MSVDELRMRLRYLNSVLTRTSDDSDRSDLIKCRSELEWQLDLAKSL